MQKIRNRYLIILFLMLLTSIIIQFFSYNTYPENEISSKAVEKIPLKLGMWQGVDVTLEEKVYEILESRSIVHRKYLMKEESVFLSIVYYPETKVDFHTPENCLAGQGVQISKTEKTIDIAMDKQNKRIHLYKLIRKYDQHREIIYYFYKAGDFIGPNYIKLRISMAMNKFFSKDKSGALIRVSTPISSTDTQAAEERLQAFIGILYPFLMKYL